MIDRENSWSWLGFFIGPVYLFICGAYVWSVLILAIQHIAIFISVLIFRSFMLYYPINFLIMTFCGFMANRIIQKPMEDRHDRYIQKFRDKGYKGKELVEKVRKKEMGLIRILLGFTLAFFAYWLLRHLIVIMTAMIFTLFQSL
jgi:hypothetical protein